jgi:predicted nucleic acid-binding protein
MKGFVPDTQLYIHAYRDPTRREAFRDFLEGAAPFVYVSAVARFEVLSGARTPGQAEELERAFFAPFAEERRIFAPDEAAWEAAATALAEMARDGEVELKRMPKSFQNDVLLATSCAGKRFTLITDNTSDFRRIQRRVAVDLVAPWPAVSR